MTNFRILQTQLLSEPLPYEVEELIQVWYRFRPVWRSVREQFVPPFTLRATIRRFQTPREAGLYIERRLAARQKQLEEGELRHEEQHQKQKLPRIVQEYSATVLG